MRVLGGLGLIASFAFLAASDFAGVTAGASALSGVRVGASALPCEAAGAFLRSQSAAARRDGTVVIRGRVATHAHAALSGAEVSISASTFRTLTTDRGTYRLSIPGVLMTATQARRVTAARTGYEPQVLPLELSPGDSIVVDFVLCPAGSEDGGAMSDRSRVQPPWWGADDR